MLEDRATESSDWLSNLGDVHWIVFRHQRLAQLSVTDDFAEFKDSATQRKTSETLADSFMWRSLCTRHQCITAVLSLNESKAIKFEFLILEEEFKSRCLLLFGWRQKTKQIADAVCKTEEFCVVLHTSSGLQACPIHRWTAWWGAAFCKIHQVGSAPWTSTQHLQTNTWESVENEIKQYIRQNVEQNRTHAGWVKSFCLVVCCLLLSTEGQATGFRNAIN